MALEKELSVLDYAYVVFFDCFPLFSHVLIFLIKLIL